MSPLRLSILLGAAFLMTSCVDDLTRKDSAGDGTISFALDGSAENLFSRGGGDSPTLSYHTTLALEPVENQGLWLHVESAENPATYVGETRGDIVTLDDMNEFEVTATLNTDGSEKAFINAETVTKSGNRWHTSDTYYWPQSDELTFYCSQSTLPPKLTSLEKGDAKYTFDYEVPVSTDGSTDAAEQPDFVLATHKYSRASAPGGVADIHFQHPLAGICFVQDASLPDEKLRIKKITISGLKGKGSCVFDGSNSEYTREMASKWTLDSEAETVSYTQTAALSADDYVNVPVSGTSTVKAVAPPFMVIPHSQDEIADLTCTVEMAGGDIRTAKLSAIGKGYGLMPGRMYVVTLSGLDAKYPPVENLQGMAGNGTVTLTWDNPELSFDHVKQCGVTVRIMQKKGTTQADAWLQTVIHWKDGDGHTDLFPSNRSKLDLFAYVKTGYKVDVDGKPILDADGNLQTIDISTRLYNEFECKVFADYYNINDNEYKDNVDNKENWDKIPVHQSIARDVTIYPDKTDDNVLFYVPEGAKKGDEIHPDGLLDDDDVAAWQWFKNTYPNGTYVTKNDLAEKAKEGYNVLWVPCGVKLRGGGEAGYGEDYTKVSDDAIKKVEDILSDNTLNTLPYNDYHKDLFPDLKQFGSNSGMYDDPTTGTIKQTNPNEYFTQDDIDAIKKFYGEGGNLLLTTFSIELVYELEVITSNCRPYDRNEFRPHFHLFNEIKPSSIWFVRSEFDMDDNGNPRRVNGDHPIFAGMFKCLGTNFPECEKDAVREDGKRDYDEEFYPVYVGSDKARKVPMYPLLSMGAEACENNNVVWDFSNGHQAGKGLIDMEDNNNGRFLATWGQVDNLSVGVIFEFYPGPTDKNTCPYTGESDEDKRIRKAHANHGRCIAIGLGAYEFNNGLKYDPAGEVLNNYQSNVTLMTKNALNYLMTAKSDERAPGEKVAH